MKENTIQVKEEVQNVRQAEVPKKLEFLGRLKPQKNHILFEFNYKTGEIKPASFRIEAVNFTDAKLGEITHKKKIIVNENCTYVPALNVKNAFKRLGIKVNIIKGKSK